MKKIALSLIALVSLSSFGVAGGDFKEIEPVVVVPVILEVDHSGFYAGLALTVQRTFSTEGNWVDDTLVSQDKTAGVSFIVGYDYNEYLAFEGRYNTSFYDEDYANITSYSIFLKPQYPITEEFKIYGLLGFGKVEVVGADGDYPTAPNLIGVTIADESSFQWGFGASYMAMEDITLFFDFSRLMDHAEIDSQLYGYNSEIYRELTHGTLTLGITYKF